MVQDTQIWLRHTKRDFYMRKLLPAKSNITTGRYLEFKSCYVSCHTLKYCITVHSSKNTKTAYMTVFKILKKDLLNRYRWAFAIIP